MHSKESNEHWGINISGEYVYYSKFADDIAIIAKSQEELISLIKDTKHGSERIGLDKLWDAMMTQEE